MARSAPYDPDVAEAMNAFFKSTRRSFSRYFVPPSHRDDPSSIAKTYAKFLNSDSWRVNLITRPGNRGRYAVGMSIGSANLEFLTKRSALVADTLLLSHSGQGLYHKVQEGFHSGGSRGSAITGDPPAPERNEDEIGFICPDITEVGKWILDAKELLTQGRVWYMPSFARRLDDRIEALSQPAPIDFLIHDRLLVPSSPERPLVKDAIRVVLQLDLPFVDGVSLKEFCKITVGEAYAYEGFRNLLRRKVLELDSALDAVHSERALALLNMEISDGLREVEAKMRDIKGMRRFARGTVVGATAATLYAARGDALPSAIEAIVSTMIGGGGLLFDYWQSGKEQSGRVDELRTSGWYYIWRLDSRRR
ncbi:hypothetical protein ACIQRW_38030 [Streptomyces sp. NPDC091287]|uniref:hypothetical protein n=1 Tax=Streptomyces sp. NPDC091287 TaxID=3365988 RepID=UPI0037F4CD62